jgi:hypothetical protein
MSDELQFNWTMGEQIEAAASAVDEVEAEAVKVAASSGYTEPQWAAVLACASEAVAAGASIAAAARGANDHPLAVVPRASGTLVACLEKLGPLDQTNWHRALWPNTWGIKFARLTAATNSALDAAMRFAHQIRSICWNEARSIGGYEGEAFRQLPILYDPFAEEDTTKPAEAWANRILSRVGKHALPADWEPWKIRQEAGALVSLLHGEYERLQRDIARQKETELDTRTHALLAAAVDEVRARAVAATSEKSHPAEVDVARVASHIGVAPDTFKLPAFFARFRINDEMLRQLASREGVGKRPYTERKGYNEYCVGDVIRARPHLFPVPSAQPESLARRA